jgi:serine/threonine protein kinase
MSLPPGASLAQYTIRAPISAVGMGEVYRARDARLGRDVAVEILPADVCANAERLRRFDQEARAPALNHTNIPVVYDIGTDDGTPYVVAEFLEGVPFSATVAWAPPLRKPRQAVYAVIVADPNGIVHRDLKSAAGNCDCIGDHLLRRPRL